MSGGPLELLTPATRRLPDGTLGWYVRLPRSDDCWQAAVATCIQVPIDEVPDSRLDERLAAGQTPNDIAREVWQEFGLWVADRGLRMIVHRVVPAPRRRWIGVVPFPGLFEDHCVVMNRSTMLFDPIASIYPTSPLAPPAGAENRYRLLRVWVKWGYSFARSSRGDPNSSETTTRRMRA